MSRKPARTKPPRAPTATRRAAAVRRHRRARPMVTHPRQSSTESIAASIMDLMVLAADAGTPVKVDTIDKDSQIKAALTDLIAVRFDADD